LVSQKHEHTGGGTMKIPDDRSAIELHRSPVAHPNWHTSATTDRRP
jgi:hypothetical protein